jgi:hypothetical protein
MGGHHPFRLPRAARSIDQLGQIPVNARLWQRARCIRLLNTVKGEKIGCVSPCQPPISPVKKGKLHAKVSHP